MEDYADMFHIDVADSQFTPGLLFFPDLVAALRPLTTKPFHVHLMVADPSALAPEFVRAGADLVSVHVEIGSSVESALAQLHDLGVHAGIAIQLETPVEVIVPFLEQVDLVLVMGTPIGIKGCSLDKRVPGKISALKRLLSQCGRAADTRLSADGGIRIETVPDLRVAGVDVITPGSLFFGSPDIRHTVEWLYGL